MQIIAVATVDVKGILIKVVSTVLGNKVEKTGGSTIHESVVVMVAGEGVFIVLVSQID